MAILVVDGDVIRTVIYAQDEEQAGLMVHHYLASNQTGVGGDLRQLALILDGAFAPVMKAIMTNSANYVGVGVRRIFPTVSVELIETGNFGGGSAGAEGMSRQTSGIITLKTDFPGRSFRGRKYVPFPAEADSVSWGFPSTSYMARLDNVRNELGLGRAASGPGVGDAIFMSPAVWSRTFSVATPMTSSKGKQLWATQRRRSSFGRANIAPS